MFLEIYLVDGGGGKSEGVVQCVKVSLHTALAVTQCAPNSQPCNKHHSIHQNTDERALQL